MTEFIVVYLSSEESFGLRRSCTEVRRPEFWLGEGFDQTRRKSQRKVTSFLFFLISLINSRWASTLAFCLWPLGILPSLPGPRLVCVCVCVAIPFILDVRFVDVPARVTQEEEGHKGFHHLLSEVLALIFLARRLQSFLSLVDREVEFCVLRFNRSPLVGHFFFL